jgi:integrase/recombinase XerD
MKKGKSYGSQMFKTTGFEAKQKDLNEIAEEYFRLCTIRGISYVTINSYRNALKYFIRFNGTKPITVSSLNDYIYHLKQTNIKDITISSYCRNLTPILNYGYDRGYLPKVEIIEIKTQKEMHQVYSDEQMKLLLSRPKENDFVTIRNWTMVWVFASTAIRRNELIHLKVGNVNLIEKTIALNTTKSKKPRYVPISTSLCEVLERYLVVRNSNNNDDILFPTVYNDMLSTSTINKELEKYNRSRGIELTGIHIYRHTFITNAVNNNTNILIIKKITGHSSLAILNGYYNAQVKDIVDVIDDIAPKNVSKKNVFKK